MNLSLEQVERVVAEVVRRLTAVEPATALATKIEVRAEPVASPATLQLSERLVTMATLDGRLANAARLMVPSKAIVTPQVRDELKKRKIELVRCDRPQPTAAVIRLLVAADSASQSAGKGLAGLVPQAEMIESQATSSLAGTVKELARHVAARQTPGLLLTEQPFAAVAAAGSAAAHVRSVAEVAQAKKELNVRLFVVEVAKLQRPALVRIAAAIL